MLNLISHLPIWSYVEHQSLMMMQQFIDADDDDDDGDDDDEDKVSVMWDGGREVDDAATNHKNYVKQQTTTIPIQHTAL